MNIITIQKGNPYTAVITITDASGDPYNLTDKTVFFTVKNQSDVSDNDDKALIKHKITNHTNATGGITTLLLSAKQTNIPDKDYKCDIRIYTTGLQINSITFNAKVIDIVTKRTS